MARFHVTFVECKFNRPHGAVAVFRIDGCDDDSRETYEQDIAGSPKSLKVHCEKCKLLNKNGGITVQVDELSKHTRDHLWMESMVRAAMHTSMKQESV